MTVFTRVRHWSLSWATWIQCTLPHLFRDWLFSWWRVLNKLIVAKLVKKFHAFYGTRRLIYCVHKILSLDPLLSQLNPVHTLALYVLKMHFNIILPSTPRSHNLYLPFRLGFEITAEDTSRDV